MCFLKSFKSKKKRQAPTKEQLLDALWKDWIKDKTNPPLTQIMTFIANVGAGGHAQFLDLCEKESKYQQVEQIALPLLPALIQYNYNQAKNVFINASEEQKNHPSFLDEYDEIFYDNEEMLDNLLLSFKND